MYKILIFLSLVVTTVHAKKYVEILTCTSTEPFKAYQFNPKTKILTVSFQMEEYITETISKNAIFRSVLSHESDGDIDSKYEVFDTKTNKVLITMTLNNEGTDGMSNKIYPYDAKINELSLGCESTAAPASDLYQSVSGLKNLYPL